MEFGVLGPVEVRSADGEPVAVGGPQVRALLAVLLLEPGRVIGTGRLIDGLYGEESPSGAGHALQSQVSRLRRGLRGTSATVEGTGAGYRLAVDEEAVDARRFERLAAEGRRALAAGDPARAVGPLAEALALWRGPALADVSGAPFAAPAAARLEELRLAAAEDHAEAALATGGHRDLTAGLTELLAAHPLREQLAGLLMRSLAGAGRQAAALEVFDQVRGRLADELGADPSPGLAEVHLAILRGDPEPTAATSPAAPAAGLPAELTTFVGREEELARIAGTLTRARLVTLTGPGGAGKTRLANRAGAAHRGEVRLVELADVADGAALPQAVLDALGLRGSGTHAGADGAPDPVDRVLTALAGRDLLLILDNCEHLVVPVARLADRLLRGSPGLRILATSREGLGITGEALCPVPPLPPSTAVGLFADRAAAASPGFALDDGNRDAVARICAALDGLPLAVELAAARLRTLDLAAVEERLADRFRLLSRGDRTAADRHRTLRAVVGWSWDLLSPGEQALARRLTVFAGGATAPAVRAVCAEPDADDLLADLTDKSLVEHAAGRYRMLETIRAYGAERLDEAGERDNVQAAHLAYFLAFADEADPHLRTGAQLDSLARLDAERGNLFAALRWAVRADPPAALRLVGALSWYWWLRGLRTEAAPLAGALLDALGGAPPAGHIEDYLLTVLNAAIGGVRTAAVRAGLDRFGALLLAMDPPMSRPYLYFLWAMTDRPSVAEEDADRMYALIGDDPWAVAFAAIGDGLRRQFGGEPDAALRSFTAALARFRALGDRWGIANTLDRLAELAEIRGETAEAGAMMDQAIELIGGLGSGTDAADLHNRRANGLLAAGDPAGAEEGYRRAERMARAAGDPDMLAGAHRGLGELARRRGETAEARRLYELALGEAGTASVTADEIRSRLLTDLGGLAVSASDGAAATLRFREAIEVAMRHGNGPAAAAAIEGLAGVALLDSDGEAAARLLGAAAAARGAEPAADPDVARHAEAARALLGPAGYDAAHRAGGALTPADVLAG